jgi:hypothetical protein
MLILHYFFTFVSENGNYLLICLLPLYQKVNRKQTNECPLTPFCRYEEGTSLNIINCILTYLTHMKISLAVQKILDSKSFTVQNYK